MKFKFLGGHKDEIRYNCPEFVDVFDQFPEVSHFEGNIPASGFFIRNAKNIDFINCRMEVTDDDNRAVIFYNRSCGNIVLTKISNVGSKIIEGYKSSVNCINNLRDIKYMEVGSNISKEFDSIITNGKEYRKYTEEIAVKLNYCYIRDCDKPFDINNNNGIIEIKPELTGNYYIYVSRVLVEFDIFIDNKKESEHRYAGGYALFYTYVTELSLNKESTITIKFKDITGFGSHHGIYDPITKNEMYGPIGFIKNI